MVRLNGSTVQSLFELFFQLGGSLTPLRRKSSAGFFNRDEIRKTEILKVKTVRRSFLEYHGSSWEFYGTV